MERKWHALKSKGMVSEQKIKHDKQGFFEDLYQQCAISMNPKHFQFFLKSVIPTKFYNDPNKTTRQKLNKQEPVETNFINTMKSNIFSQRTNLPYNQMNKSKVLNKQKQTRIVSTPKNKTRQIIEMNNYKEFVMTKKMRDVQSRIKTDIYQPQPIFQAKYQNRSQQAKIVLSRNKKSVLRPFRHMKKNKNYHIPLQMISIIKLPQENKTIHWSSTNKLYIN